MSSLPAGYAVTAKLRTPFFLILITAGLAGNYFKFPLFLDIDFLFGSIFAMLALQFFGVGRGILAAAIIASYTYVLWNHPYAIIIMTAEVAVVGWLMWRYKIGMVLADTLYWLIIGMPLAFLFYHLVMHVPPSNTYIVMTIQAVNGIANALLARLIFTVYTLRSRSFQTSYRDIAYNLMAFFVLCPTLIQLAIESRTDFIQTDHRIRTQLIQAGKSLGDRLESWVANRQSAIINLAEMAAAKTPQEMQPFLELIKKSDVNFPGVGLLDRTATTTAYFPLVDDQGASTIGIKAPDRPYLSVLKQTLKPMLSEVLMGRAGIPKPRVFVLAPVVVHGEFNGYAIGVLSLEQIRAHLESSSKDTTLLYTLLDKQNNVIMSNRTDQTVMTPFVRRDKGALNHLGPNISQWVPEVPASANTPVSERWKQSFYVTETTIGNLAEWKLLLEQPVAPFQKTLYDNYSGKLILLFLVLLGALALAEFLSRRFITTLEKLCVLTRDLPIRIVTNDGEITWPDSAMTETNQLVNNFRNMATWLRSQFNENSQINESLEHRVAERTAELTESKERYRAILDASPVPMGINDGQQNIIYVNPAFVQTFGYTLEDIPTLSHWWSKAYPDLAYRQEVTEAWHVNLDTARRTVTVFSPLEIIVTCKDLTKKTVLVTAASFPDTFKKDHVVILHDITERKRMEQQLNESVRESRSAYSLMRMLCDNVPDMIWAKDLKKRYLFANKALCSDLLNASNTEEPIGKMDMFFAERERTRHPDNPEWHTFGEICRDTDDLVMDAGTPQQFDEYGNIQGKFLFLDVHKAPFLDDTGRMIGTVGSARNVTTIKVLEEKLKKSEVSLRTLVQTIPDLILLKDPTGVYLDCNPMFERFFGAAKKDIIGKTDYDFVDRELADFFREHDRRALTAGAPTSNEEWLTFADNGYRGLFDTIKTPMYDAEGKLIGVLGIAHDITERKQAEEALQVSLAEKEVLLREVHHRVKNNMAAIIGLLNLQQNAINDPQAQMIIIDLSSRIRAMSLVHEKLYLSESLARIDFQNYLQSLISHLRTSFGSQSLHCEIAAQGVEMPLDLAVPCGMIINELMTNALKYAFPKERAEQGIEDRISVSIYNDNGIFTLSVADNGIGLPPGVDLNSTATLGLTLVQMLGEHQLGGQYVIDQVGGTKFTLTFSLQDGGKPYA